MNIAGRNIINSEADAKTVWQQIYAKEYPEKKPLVAPVQHSSKADIKKSEKKTKVVKAKQEEIHDIEKTVPKSSPIETQEPEKPIKTEAEPIDEQKYIFNFALHQQTEGEGRRNSQHILPHPLTAKVLPFPQAYPVPHRSGTPRRERYGTQGTTDDWQVSLLGSRINTTHFLPPTASSPWKC